MKRLLNTLYITSPDTYLALDGENVVVRRDSEILLRVPLHNLEGIVKFGYLGVSPALMGACAGKGISLVFMTSRGRFLATVVGEIHGNVVLRRTQYRVADDASRCLMIARNCLVGKLYNSRWVLERTVRDHALRVNVERLKQASNYLADTSQRLNAAMDLDSLRGFEGDAATQYFSVFDELILQQKEAFFFKGRSRRPPLDNVNAMLSFAYTLLASECTSALSAVGLDPFVGFLHQDRPGRRSLALDLMEELRSVFADRLVLNLINNRQITADGFLQKENGAVVMQDETRRIFLESWQKKKQERIAHPFLKEKIEWGLVPHMQALLLARFLRGDLDAYPPFLWK